MTHNTTTLQQPLSYIDPLRMEAAWTLYGLYAAARGEEAASLDLWEYRAKLQGFPPSIGRLAYFVNVEQVALPFFSRKGA